ncbi:hypothetical protein, partial [Escherichia coli]|uniref:hypothetical protein n=1 Tax=Escherichia coli TaxID=562 RepID=UPI0021D40F0E
ADRNRSHWSTSKTPSYTKSVSWQHHPTELNSKSQSPALGLGHEFAHAQYYLLDKENFMALLSRTDKKYENKEEARVITIIESRAAKTLGECTRGAHSGLPFYRVDGPLQTMKITGTPE